MNRTKQHRRPAIILLVVLSMLTFFSLLTAAYLVFSNQARQASFALSTRNIKQPNPNGFLNEALMTLVRGTSNPNDPFFGEDLLSDYYGVNDFSALQVRTGSTVTEMNGFIRLPIAQNSSVTGGQAIETNAIDDVYAGRIITFTSGKLANRSYRILRSIGTIGTPVTHDLIFNRDPEFGSADIAIGDLIWMNGIPRNAIGIGFDGTQVTESTPLQSTPAGGYPLPRALQPNHLLPDTFITKQLAIVNKRNDFDESYDAADFNNWFLSHRRSDNTNTVIPSFHRPAVLNYILNELGATTTVPPKDLLISLARGTFRPLPIHSNVIGGTKSLNERFTGGSQSFALRQPLQMSTSAQIDQFAKAIIQGPWDVDNDSDGIPDSVWIDLGLPVFTSPEGKLLKPLIAPMIEDLSGRLNLNAHSNFALMDASNIGTALVGTDWAGTGTSNLFRGVGYGPAEINIPLAPPDKLYNLLVNRYFNRGLTTDNLLPGEIGADGLHVLTNGSTPNIFDVNTCYGNSVDPYGRSGVGVSVNGNLGYIKYGTQLPNDSLTVGAEPSTGEFTDNPYEFDPSGQLGGDRAYTTAELEPLLRQNDFDRDLLPTRLADIVDPMVVANPALKNSLTTISKSDERPAVLDNLQGSAYQALRRLIGGSLSESQYKQLVAPDIRLGNKLDLNRPFGNGVDDDATGTPGFKVVDNPSERFLAGVDDDGDGDIDEADETSTELYAFGAYSGAVVTPPFLTYSGAAVPPAFVAESPDYDFDEPLPVSARQMYARNLYVLMMTISKALSGSFPCFGDTILPTPKPVSDKTRYQARRLAQWAVNVVDFRDPDSIMTAFEYDENPFDGWSVDGNLLTIESNRGVVWGAENPELVFSESLALHDVRVRDSNLDLTGKTKGASAGDDDDTDQVRVPQGSLFFELYCPRHRVAAVDTDASSSGIPRELYDVTGSPSVSYKLDLDRTVTTHYASATSTYGKNTDPSYETPVWRIAISQPHYAAAEKDKSPLVQRATLPDALSFQPERLDELDFTATPTNKLTLERFVFFQNYADVASLQNAIKPIPEISSPYKVYFYQSGGSPSLGAEQYLTLAPRTKTSLGSTVYSVGSGPTAPSPQKLMIDSTASASGLIQYDLIGTQVTPDTSSAILPGVSLAMGGFAPSSWPAGSIIGMNVSEPLASNTYYQQPTKQYTTVGGTSYLDIDAYVRLDAAGAVADGLALGMPEDIRVQGPIYDLTLAKVTPLPPDPALVADPILGTETNYRTAFLQRLADPTRGFHPILNPYLTLDQIAIDLTVFSGEDTPNNVTKPGIDPLKQRFEFPYAKASRQRDGMIAGTASNALYSYSTTDPALLGLTAPVTYYFQDAFTTTYNFLNSNFGAPQTGVNRGRPTTPFGMHPWLNRSFASPMELMLVPACSPARLFEEFTITGPSTIPTVFPDPTKSPGDPEYAKQFLSPYRHLLNFFHSRSEKHTGNTTAEFAKLFDLVSAGASFRGETEALLPSRVNGSLLEPLYHAPYCFVPGQSRNGRINLNSISSLSVWAGLMQGHLNSDEFTTAAGGSNATQLSFNAFERSRRGFDPVAFSPITGSPPFNYDNHLNPGYPTEFGGIFKNATDAPLAMQLRDLTGTTDIETNQLRRRSVDSTVVRAAGTLPEQDLATSPTPANSPMFVRSTATELPIASYMDRNRNSLLRYQTLMRMPNLTADNSQTFLVRLTMGFFEVDAANISNLGAEYNETIGQNQRYQAMFIIDRSIPVGFIPGQDLNARKTVVFERFYQ